MAETQTPIVESRNTGWIPDTPDARDFVFANLIASGRVTPPQPDAPYQTILWKPEILGQPNLELKDFSQNSPGVYDQGDSTSSCVANALAIAAAYAWRKKPGEEQDHITGTSDHLFNPSRWWIWYHARRLGNPDDAHRDVGCTFRNAFRAMHQFGVPPDAVWPYPPLTTGDYPDVPWDVMQNQLKQDPDDNMYKIASQNFISDFEYYSIKTIGLDDYWWSNQGDVEPPPEASDRILQIQTALAEGYPVIFAIGEFMIKDLQNPTNPEVWFRPMWDQSNFTFGNDIEGGLADDVIMKDLDPGYFPTNAPIYQIGERKNGHAMVIVGSDAKRHLFLCQNSYGIYPDQAKNRQKKPFWWLPYSYCRTRFIDAPWVIRYKPGIRPPPPPPPPEPTDKASVIVQISDNYTGANVNKNVETTGKAFSITDILGASTSTVQFVTSVQLKGAPQGAVATVKKNGNILGVARSFGNDYVQFPRTTLDGVTIEVTV